VLVLLYWLKRPANYDLNETEHQQVVGLFKRMRGCVRYWEGVAIDSGASEMDYPTYWFSGGRPLAPREIE
jgi:hypothetical protein